MPPEVISLLSSSPPPFARKRPYRSTTTGYRSSVSLEVGSLDSDPKHYELPEGTGNRRKGPLSSLSSGLVPSVRLTPLQSPRMSVSGSDVEKKAFVVYEYSDTGASSLDGGEGTAFKRRRLSVDAAVESKSEGSRRTLDRPGSRESSNATKIIISKNSDGTNAQRLKPALALEPLQSSPRQAAETYAFTTCPTMTEFDSDNPFLSPLPQKTPPAKEQSTSKRSMVEQDAGAVYLESIHDSSFLSGSSLQKPKSKSLKAGKSWDPISSSEPQGPKGGKWAFRPTRECSAVACSLQRPHLEVIAIESPPYEGSNAGARPGKRKTAAKIPEPSSDKEFPDINNLTAARAPIRSIIDETTSSRKGSEESTTKAKCDKRNKTNDEKAQEKAERAKKAAARETERERKKQDKQRAKDKKAREDANAAVHREVNRLRTNKKVAALEMLVDLSHDLPDNVVLAATELLETVQAGLHRWSSPVKNVVKWRRKVDKRYNEDTGLWVQVPMTIQPESYALVVVPATDFVSLVLAKTESLEAHVARMLRHFPGDTLIYLIQGLNDWMRDNRNALARAYAASVRSGLAYQQRVGDSRPAPAFRPPAAAAPKRRKSARARAEYIDEDVIEDALLQLQVVHHALIHHTTKPIDTAHWISIFTQHIATAPYRRQREADNADGAAFCMDSGQVRSGDEPRGVFVRMLQQPARVTAPMAEGIMAEFGSVSELVRSFEREGPLAVEGVRKGGNADGALTDRVVGQAVSRRLCKIFTGRDPTSEDV